MRERTIRPNWCDVEDEEEENEEVVASADKEEDSEAGEQEREAEGEDDMEEEAKRPRGIPRPEAPTQREKDEHYLTHWPFRSWCIHCMKGKSKSLPHRKVREEDGHGNVPLIAIDYMYAVTKDAEERRPTIVVTDEGTGAVFAHVVTGKGRANGWISKKICEDINFLGYATVRIVVKGDQERSLNDVFNEVKQMREAPTVIINSPVGESRSNGRVENRIQAVQGQMRTLKSSLEH